MDKNLNQKKDSYIDVDRTVLEPSPQRVRNILTLEERVRAIHAYDCRPMYTKVAKMFNCSWEQIKNIILNRDAIMQFYAATKNVTRLTDINQDDIRQKKFAFLGECLYEYIQRAQFHTKADLTEEMIRVKAFEFRDIIQIENFTPTRAFINHFKATYNFSISNRQINLTRTPPASLDLKDIMTYCTKNKMKLPENVNNIASKTNAMKNLYRTTTKIAISTANDATLEEIKQRRQRKINFLEKALYEYITRAQQNHKIQLTEELLRKIAGELKDMLKIDNFTPSKLWYVEFHSRYYFTLIKDPMQTVKSPLSLDLKDILSYCSRHDHNKKPTQVQNTAIKLAPKNLLSSTTSASIARRNAPPPPGVTIEIPAASIRLSNRTTITSESNSSNNTRTIISNRIKEEIIELDDDDDVKVSVEEINSQMKRKTTEQAELESSPLKVQKIAENEYDDATRGSPSATTTAVHSPGHWSEDSNDDDSLPREVRTYADALKLLKPLEEFAMLQENYRVIGLISQLEEHLKNPPKSTDNEE